MDDIPAIIIGNDNITLNYFCMKLKLAKAMGPVRPGQFVMVKIPGSDVFLRRPFSIYESARNTITVMYRVVGKGTELLSGLEPDQKTFVLGPLGNGFNIRQRDEYLIIAGGIGIAGVRLLAKTLKQKARIFYGCSTKEELKVIEDLSRYNPSISTLDGSAGVKGNVVALFAKYMTGIAGKDAEVFTCGPDGMVRGLRKILEKTGTACQVLVEERMACGIGLCFGCVIKTVDEKEPYKRTCKEGPVFDLWQISQ
ncbi:MAG TPA: dihydroorotate dehydrogenase electron transfer subunit [Syntrophorhabdaceae bacterium]|nr:dihydroorotate dehydrogenase electron transfer subunit [Syntrophorhabdaceae bacterium]